MKIFRISPANNEWYRDCGWWCPGVTVLAESVEQALQMIEEKRDWMGWDGAGELAISEIVGPCVIRDRDVDA